MRLLIKNCTLVSIAENRPKYEEHMDILVENDTIVRIDQNITDDVDNVIDANENVVMPGLINCHSHVPMSIFRETVDGYGLQDWLTQKIWPIEDKLTPKDIYDASILSFKEMVETGTTTVNDMYFFGDEIIKAAKEIGVRLQTTRSLMDLLGPEDGEKRLEEVSRLLREYSNEELITINAGLHGLYTSSKPYAQKCIEFAKDNNINLHMHFCENSKEVSDIYSSYNEAPTEFLKQNLQGKKTILAHCVKLTDEDIEDISKIDADISVATCPVSNLKLGCGIPKIAKMQDKGINVCIGTDGQGSGCNLDLFEEMKYTALLQKGLEENPKLMPAYNVLKMATINGAKALGLENKIGSIEEGKKADIILVDIHSTLTTPINDLIAELVYNIKGSNVKTTIINGKIVMDR